MSKPSLMRAGPWAWAKMQEVLAHKKMGWPEYFRALAGMHFRPVKKQGKTTRQLMKQRARNQRRRPRELYKNG